jgi:hypothetical protein
MSRKRRVHSPVLRVRASMGLAPRLSVSSPRQSRKAGVRQSRKRAALMAERLVLAPAGVIHLGVHVGVEAVFRWTRLHPGGDWLFLGEADGDDGFTALETVLPGHDQPQRCAILDGQHLPVKADGQQGEGMAGLVQAQGLVVRPVQYAAGHGGLVVVGDELHEACAALGVNQLEEAGQGNADPRDDH